MSRLIFEGDTRERFGKLFPKPFIEEIRVFDEHIEADVALYFEIEEGVTALQFITNNNFENLRIYIGPQVKTTEILAGASVPIGVTEDIISLLLDSSNDFFYQNPLSISEGGLALAPLLSSFDSESFYNSEGKKFIKFFISRNIQAGTSSDFELFFRQDRGESSYLLTYSFFGDMFDEVSQYFNDLSLLNKALFPFYYTVRHEYENNKSNFRLLKSQVSELSYEKVTNSDGTMASGRTSVYLEQDGNYYNKIPLMSLDRNYRKTNLINHSQVANTIQPIIQPFVGTIEEADLISSTLQTNMNNPRLLIELQRNINNFSNKSTATTTGTLYEQLVTAVSDIDSVLVGSDTVEKRLEVNSKVIDLRGDVTFIDQNSQLNLDNIRPQGGTQQRYVYPFMLTCNKVAFHDGTVGQEYLNETPTVEDIEFLQSTAEHTVFYTNLYSFFDFEKTINFDSNISEFFNPYNIFQLFDKNVLNKYFKVKQVDLFKRFTEADSQENLDTLSNIFQARIDVENNVCSLQKRNLKQLIRTTKFIVSYRGNVTKETAFTNIRKIKFEPLAAEFGQIDYRLFTINLEDYDIIPRNSYIRYIIEYSVEDSTMEFFLLLKELIFSEFNRIEEYYNLASEFCSYNNIDGRFNDFFQESMQTYPFSEKLQILEQEHPWQTAPFVYFMLESLIEASYLNEGDYSFSNRKINGSLIDINKLKNTIDLESQLISPIGGNLENLEVFYLKIQQMKTLFEKENGFDRGNRIYDDTVIDDYELINPLQSKTYEREQDVARGTTFTQYDVRGGPGNQSEDSFE